LADKTIHRSGYVNILGSPNMGKSTLLNQLVGEKISIITSKPQTTRHRLIAILNGDDFQIVFSDTPGYIESPSYKMHEKMNAFIHSSFADADLIIFMTDPFEPLNAQLGLISKISQQSTPVIAVINKSDLADDATLSAREAELKNLLPQSKIKIISALNSLGIQSLLQDIIGIMPEGPEYFPKDQLTDRPERFFVSELIRENILELYRDEIPYTCEVKVESFSEGESKSGPITRISAVIYTMDDRKKSILLGKGGSAIKELGMESRKDIEAFLGKRVFLDLVIKVRENWRDDDLSLTSFGYQN
jgi:GTP-binding protein Era